MNHVIPWFARARRPPCLKVYLGIGICIWKPSPCQFALPWTANGHSVPLYRIGCLPGLCFWAPLQFSKFSFTALQLSWGETRQDDCRAPWAWCTHGRSCGHGHAWPPAGRMRTQLGCWVSFYSLKSCYLSPCNLHQDQHSSSRSIQLRLF